MNQLKIQVPFDAHFSFYIKYFRLKVCVFLNDSLTDSFVQHFESFLQMGINTNLNQSESPKAQVIKNFPNPCNSETTISYQLLHDTEVSLKIYNSIGQEIAELISADQPAGEYAVKWNPVNLGTNTYYIKLKN